MSFNPGSGSSSDPTLVHVNGAETITGVKTFSSAPVVPDNSFPITANQGLQTSLDSKLQYSPYVGYIYVRALGDNTIPTNPVAGMLLLNRTS